MKGHVQRGGQSSNEATEVGRVGTGQSTTVGGHVNQMTPRGAVVLSVTPTEVGGLHPSCQLVPDQLEKVSQLYQCTQITTTSDPVANGSFLKGKSLPTASFLNDPITVAAAALSKASAVEGVRDRTNRWYQPFQSQRLRIPLGRIF
ncbi:hypothetical protein D3C74_35200 [compost metagenome]